MSGSNCCFWTHIHASQQIGKVVWYSHLLKNFPQFVVIHTVKGFSIVNEAEVDVFLELHCIFYDSVDVANLISGSSAFSKSRGMGRQWPAAGLGALSAAVPAWDLLKEVTIIFITSTIVWPQVKQQGRNTAPPINRKLD